MSRPEDETTDLSRREVLQLGAGAAAVVGIVGAGASMALRPRQAHAQDTSEPPVRWGFAIDLRKCTGCETCSIACKTQNKLPLGVFRNSVKFQEAGTYPATKLHALPWLCQHCSDAPCIANCPVDEIDAALTFPDGEIFVYAKKATYIRPDGVVRVDEDRCIGCGQCVALCPYKDANNAISMRFLDPETNKANKCDFCINRVERGLAPACVQACPAGARVFGNLADAGSDINTLLDDAGSLVKQVVSGTEPNTFYIVPEASTDVGNIFDNGTDNRDQRHS